MKDAPIPLTAAEHDQSLIAALDYANVLERKLTTERDRRAECRKQIELLDRELAACRTELQTALEATEPRSELLALKTRAEKAEDELDSLRADKARLDWMQENKCHEGVTMAVARYSYKISQWDGSAGPNIRLAIDTERFSP